MPQQLIIEKFITLRVSIFLLAPQHRGSRLPTKFTELVEARIESVIKVNFETGLILLVAGQVRTALNDWLHALSDNFSDLLFELADMVGLLRRELHKGFSPSLLQG